MSEEVIRRFDEDITVMEKYLTIRFNAYIKDVLRDKTCNKKDFPSIREECSKYWSMFNVVNETNSSLGFNPHFGVDHPVNLMYSLNVFADALDHIEIENGNPVSAILVPHYLNSTYRVVRK